MRWIRFSKLMVVGIFGLAVMTTIQAQVVAKVNGVAIPQSRLDLMIKAAAAQGQPDSSELRKAIRENLIIEEIINQEAKKKGLDKNPEVQTQIRIAARAVLARAFQVEYIKKNAASDETLRREYEILKLQMGDKEYKARHILVKDESEAKVIMASLRKGADFGKIAREKSIDEGSKNDGGKLAWSPSAAYVRSFAKVLEGLKKGKFAESPVQTSFGWHIVQLEDIRAMEIPPFEKVKQNIQQRVLQQEFSAVIQNLRAKAKVE